MTPYLRRESGQFNEHQKSSKMNSHQSIFWVDLNRFDKKPDKSTWLEISDVLIERGYRVTILTGYASEKYVPDANKVSIEYFNAIDSSGLFRYSLLKNIYFWLVSHARSSDIIILPPGALYIAPFLKKRGYRNLHLDVRTVPVDIHTLRDKIDRLLFWTIPLKYFRKNVAGYSYITDRLRESVEQEFGIHEISHVIWQSGVNTRRFTPSSEVAADDKYVLFYHGTLTENRGISRVVDAIKMLDRNYRENIQFVIVGTGKGFDSLAALIEKENLHGRVIMKGFVPYERIPEEIRHADCCICPLPDYPEWNVSSPIKIFEYMACGKPMILSLIPAHQDVAENCDFVIWADGFDAQSFKMAIQRAYDERERLKLASQDAASFVNDNYSWDIQGNKLGDYLSRLFKI
jgi:glycosyltransferase involved in cell wall biosynthesis